MASSVATVGTNSTFDLLLSQVGDRRNAIPQALIRGTLASGFRMISSQDRATKTIRHVKLHAWYCIRRLTPGDVLQALRAEDRCTTQLQQAIVEAMSTQKVYHVVLQGKDPRFVPPGDHAVREVVTSYICDDFGRISEHAEELLFDQIGDPDAIRQAMDNPQFDRLLQQWYESGDLTRQDRLRLVGRMGDILLHKCIMENQLETIQLLLDSYTAESHPRTPWRVLAEPLYPFGSRNESAFHCAVRSGSDKALALLLAWASRHSHGITHLKVVVEREPTTQVPIKERDCLELAAALHEWKCYNLLAPLFGRPLTQDLESLPEPSSDVSGRPRVVLICPRGYLLKRVCLQNETWSELLRCVAELNASEKMKRAAKVRLRRVSFADEATAEDMGRLFDACAGLDGVQAIECKFKSDLSWIVYLKSLNQRLSAAVTAGCDAKSILPRKVELACCSSEDLTPEAQISSDSDAYQMISEYLEVASLVPSFLGAELTTPQHRARFATFEDGGHRVAAAYASAQASLVSDLVSDQLAEGSNYMDWARRKKLMPMPSAVYRTFFENSTLLEKQFDDPRDALNPAVACFLRLTLRAWFKPLEKLPGNDPFLWSAWQAHLGVEEPAQMGQLAESLDLALVVLLEMREVLDYVLRKESAEPDSVASLLRACVPATILSRLPAVSEKLAELQVEKKPSKKKVSLLAPTSGYKLRPQTVPR